ncbi:hypothetical protein C5L31_001743 [Secundilactobacillus malefermentans]|uniref:Phosphoribosyltransferase domain-containing protein n=3 Tax=Secundilactobacillus malefermentans TaxID=176292 RepID=A0A4V3A2Y3_9LACO|nr:phosphoribosyltransferase [Secundilactobacillus malefermentans DSM 5705 = KCTC 3548]QEA32042.1 ComF family protein [Secundilactobacillus malefermentans]TDG71526.1 hypothetical protein C5L31_001743 [Secundilactobacillus malefermentans]
MTKNDCVLCHRPVNFSIGLIDLMLPVKINEPTCCDRCCRRFELINQKQACPDCGRKMKKRELCHDCVKWNSQSSLDFKNSACFVYNDEMKKFMQQYKFAGDYQLAKVFRAQFMKKIKKSKIDLIVPIPIDADTMVTRGFNQVVGLTTGQHLTSALEVRADIHKARQSSKNRRSRMETVQPFRLVNPELVANKRVLILDDVYTTGRTIRHAAALMYEAGASEVQGNTLAR